MRTFLQSAIAQNEDASWRILSFHYDVYGQGSSHALSDGKNYRDNYVPVIDDFDIDVVFNGHDHSYSRSYPMKWSGSTSTSNTQGMQPETFDTDGASLDPTGTVYFSLNSATGSKHYSLAARQPYTAAMNQANRPNFSVVDMTADTFTCTTYQVNTNNSLTEIDTYTIRKTSGEIAPFEAETLTLQPGATATALNFNWYSDRTAANNASVVQIAKRANMTSDSFPTTDIITTTNGTMGDASAGKSWHKAGITGLAGDTEYVYRVSNDGEVWSRVYSFKTSKTDSFRFAVTGDPQLTTGQQDNTSSRKDETTAEGWQDTINAITAKGVDFIAGVGDQVDITSNGSEAEYANFFAPDALRSVPFSPAVGNHDRHYLFNYHWNIPNEQSFTPIINAGNATNVQYQDMEVAGNYYYLYNNALFAVLNDSGYPESREVAAQYVELYDKTLQAATEAYAGQYDWLFVQHHKSTASLADHCADRDIQYYVEAGFETTMDKYSVDFVMAGHDHVYARSYPMNNGVPDKTGASGMPNVTLITGGDGASAATNPNGTVYFTTTTSSGLKYYELFNNAGNLYVKDNVLYPYLVDGKVGSTAYMEGNLPLSAAKYLQNKTPGYLYVEVADDTVTFKYFDLDDYSDTPYDTYTVTKAATSQLSASVTTTELSDVYELVSFAFSLRGMDHVNTIAFDFTLSGGILQHSQLESLNNFAAMPIQFTELEGGQYNGNLTLVYLGDTITSADALDVVKLFFNATDLGDATVTLSSVTVTMQPEAGGKIITANAMIDNGTATTSVIEVKVYSVYDLNRDGAIGQADLAIVALACGIDKDDPRWNQKIAEDSKGKAIIPAICDVTSDGKVDILDLLDVFVHYADAY